MQHIAIYCRVSSKTQDTAAQEAELQQWAKGQLALVNWYRDKLTGKTMDRPGFNQMLAAMRRGEVSKLVVWRLDRLGRTASGLVKFFDELIALGVNLFSLRDALDLSTAAGRLTANVLASVAAFENELRSERQTAGIAVAKAAGRKWGGSKQGRRLKVKPEQIEMAQRLKSEGASVSAIARATGLARGTVYTMIGQR